MSEHRTRAVEVIRRWHIQRGWSDIGYHYVITNGRRTARPEYVLADDGDVEPGRSIDIAGAHVRGENEDSIGVCLVAKNWFTARQLHELPRLIVRLRERYGRIPVYGHNYFNSNKTCPNIEPALLAQIVEGKI